MKINDLERWKSFKAQVDRLDLRFPIAEITEKTGFNKGYVSAVLKNKKPLSDNFLDAFTAAFLMPHSKAAPAKEPILSENALLIMDLLARIRKIEELLTQGEQNRLGMASAIKDEIRLWSKEILKELKDPSHAGLVAPAGKKRGKQARNN